MEANLKILGRPHFWPLNPFLQKRGGGGHKTFCDEKKGAMIFLDQKKGGSS